MNKSPPVIIMLTPIFSITQNPDSLVLTIHAPYAHIASTEVSVDGDEFRFFSKPYFLRLHLPGRVVETGHELVDFDFDKKEFRVDVTKETPGEHFDGLEFISTLLTKKSAKKLPGPLIEVLTDNDVEDGGADDDDDVNDDNGDEWLWDQKLESDDESKESIRLVDVQQPKYGFGNKASGLFAAKLSEERGELTDLPDPDSMTQSQRRRWKFQQEGERFDSDHYLADLFEGEEIRRMIESGKERTGGCGDDDDDAATTRSMTSFDDDEKRTLKNLPRREILLSGTKERRVALLSVLDVILAACYDYRTTDGEPTVESGWTVNKLSASLSCFVELDTVRKVITSFLRRSLVFPLYRNWELSLKCVEDAVRVLRAGKVAIVKVLIDVYKHFIVGDPRYILNDLYVTDMILWIQTVSSNKIEKLMIASKSELETAKKDDIMLELEELETAAKLVEEEEGEGGGEGDEDEDEDEEDDSSRDSESTASSSELDSDDDPSDLPTITERLKIVTL